MKNKANSQKHKNDVADNTAESKQKMNKTA